MNFTCSVRELVGDGSLEVGQTSRFLMGRQSWMSSTMRSETIQNSKIQGEIEVLTTEPQNLKIENERLHTIIRTPMTENMKMKNDNQTLLKAKEELMPMNTN
jgi:regulator of replication initiation timing